MGGSKGRENQYISLAKVLFYKTADKWLATTIFLILISEVGCECDTTASQCSHNNLCFNFASQSYLYDFKRDVISY